jgi:Trk-type K+ transport system membrane component
MSAESTRNPWLRSVLFGLLAQVLAFVAATLVVAAYALRLAMQARGTPDQQLINQFAASSSRWVTVIAGIAVTFVLANYLARKAPRPAISHSLVVGLSSAVVSTAVALPFTTHLSLRAAVAPLCLLLASWLGGLSASSRKPAAPAV